MLLKIKYLFLFLFISFTGFSAIMVPDTIQIGSVKVAIHESAKPIFEREYKMLNANKRYVITMMEKMKMFFPVIEPVLQEGCIPIEFKYLCVQESALNGNAVSTSNAVGYWQFKYDTALDNGLKVNSQVDERRHIIEATKGAVSYFNRNNNVLNNWVSTLLSYRLGLGTVKKMSIFPDWSGKNEIQVDSSTDWYVLRFLAYKNFWEEQFANNATGLNPPSLLTYTNFQGKNLLEVSDELKISYDDLKRHNPWILKDYIPNDKPYTIYHPSNLNYFMDGVLPDNVPTVQRPIPVEDPKTFVLTASVDTTKLFPENKAMFPKKKHKEILSKETEIKTHIVVSGDNLTSIAKQYGMSLAALLELNDLNMSSLLSLGQAIKYERKIPMVELISKKMDEKSKYAKAKTEEIIEVPENKVAETEEIQGPRKIETKSDKESFLIEPAESREITIHSDKPENELWKDSKHPEKQAQIQIPIIKEEKTTKTETKVITLPAEHQVLPGETLYGIAKKYGITVNDLVKFNKTLLKNGLQTGQTLQLK